MGYVFFLVGLVVLGVLFLAFLPNTAGPRSGSRKRLPRAEKEQMDAPQEEFTGSQPNSFPTPPRRP